MNSGRSKLMVGSSGGKMIVNSVKWPCTRKHLIFVPFNIILVF